MRKLIYKNTLGAELELTNSAPFLLKTLDTSNNVNIYNSKGMRQDGASYIGNTLDERDISLNIAVIGNSREEIASHKSKINRAFNPKLEEGWLIYKEGEKERKIKCIVNKLPYFQKKSSRLEYCLISLTANSSFWLDLDESKEEIALWVGDLSFDFEILPGGIEMGHREPSLIVNVNNKGDVECGMRVEFTALATLKNPALLNVNTGEYIKINKTMSAGEVVSVSTYFGSKKVESRLNGVTSNAFNYIDFQSTFLQLDVGDNLFRYDADSGLENLEVTIYYTPAYLGV